MGIILKVPYQTAGGTETHTLRPMSGLVEEISQVGTAAKIMVNPNQGSYGAPSIGDSPLEELVADPFPVLVAVGGFYRFFTEKNPKNGQNEVRGILDESEGEIYRQVPSSEFVEEEVHQ